MRILRRRARCSPPSSRDVRKTVTVLFCDVTGSTAMGERLDPESTRRVMTRYFESMREAIERHGGTVEKFIGDAVMAVFGVPVVHEDDALRAVRAAADMRAALGELNDELERDWGVTIESRIGVNTGEVVAGEGDSLTTGDAVNVAARLEQGAAPGETLLGETTYRLVRDAVLADPVEPLDAKGKSEPVLAVRLAGLVEGADFITRHLDSPLVGRENELAQLQRAYDHAVAERVAYQFTLLGPPASGSPGSSGSSRTASMRPCSPVAVFPTEKASRTGLSPRSSPSPARSTSVPTATRSLSRHAASSSEWPANGRSSSSSTISSGQSRRSSTSSTT